MNLTKIPKALMKANKAKKRMQGIKAAGSYEFLSLLINGLNEVEEVQIDAASFVESLGLNDKNIDESELEEITSKLENVIKKCLTDSKKNLEKALVDSTSLEDLKGVLDF